MDDMDNAQRVRLLEIIDKFRHLGLNEDISLPQLVVVGDQSSGKSSLLEGLTNLNFPVASDLCTRHATQIILRRTQQVEKALVRVSIIPGPSANGNEEHKLHLESFAKTLEGSDFSANEFKEILDEAAIQMGLPGPEDDLDSIEKRFSDNILKIELSGPNHHHLSVVDVPGLFHNPTKYQTEEDRGIIRGLVEHYITDPRTIILAVLDARNNLANQEVFRMARAADPLGTRTVGIITKCDAVQDGDEQGVINIAQNSVEKLNHGWFAVKNRSTSEIKKGVTIAQRHVNERKFFQTQMWKQLAKDRVGISALKKFLGMLLYSHIKSEFPGLLQEIRNHITDCRAELDSLGPSRQYAKEQRQFLSRVAARYQGIVANSLFGNYRTMTPQHPLKLRMHLHNANEEFGKLIQLNGHARPFRMIDSSVDVSYKRNNAEENIYDWIRSLYRESRGAELPGTVNPAILETMFRQQSLPWEAITKEHMVKVEQVIRNFNQALLKDVVSEDSLRAKFEALISVFFNSSHAAAHEQLAQILRDERGGVLQTINHYFADSLSQTRHDRVLERLKGSGLVDGLNYNIDLGKITKAAHLGNEDQAVNDIHDILKAYYKVAMKRFMDNVVVQIVERIYLTENGPVKAISPEYVGMLSDTELSDLASESYATSIARMELRSKLDRLEAALSVAQSEPL